MPAKASRGSGAPRDARGVDPGGHSVAPDLGGVSPFTCLSSYGRVGQTAGGSWRRRRGGGLLAAVLVREAHDRADVVLRFGIRRHTAISLHRTWTSVVGGERLARVAAEGLELLAQVLGAGVDRLSGIERVGAPERGRRARHQLAEAGCACGALGVRVEVRLLADQALQQGRVDAVLLSGRVDQLGELPADGCAGGGTRGGGGARLLELGGEAGGVGRGWSGGGLDARGLAQQLLDLADPRDGGL